MRLPAPEVPAVVAPASVPVSVPRTGSAADWACLAVDSADCSRLVREVRP